MLLSFRVANHRSIRQEQQLNLHPVYDDDRPSGTAWEAVPVAGVFGANASGKTNLVDALQYMARMVVSSHRDAEPDGGVPRHRFLLDDVAKSEPSWYIADLLLDDVRYTYGFAVDDDRVTEEWLDSYPKGKKRELFSREEDNLKPGASQETRQLELVESITEPNVLFLSLAARSRQRDFRPVYDWFAQQLRFRRSSGLAALWGYGATRALKDADRHPEILQLLRAADLGIEACGTERVQVDEEVLRRDYGKNSSALNRVLFSLETGGTGERVRPWVGHRGRDGIVQMDLQDESAGTKALLEQVPRFLDVLREGGTFVVDEIDASLHSLLTARLIGLFQNPETNRHGAQLIFTTHDPSLLGRRDGDDILKRDQIWFVEKNEYGESSLYSLADFKPRKDENRERRYLGGSYGGIPFIDESFTEALLRRGGGTDQNAETQRQPQAEETSPGH
ncbi:ATP-binding protein [Streptomyces sp. SID13726]|uniref:AAA family ATPase n=1 Tax=Streptomyces sp. SID13726 TaxID=2706058 RepID=UPI0013BD7972|nr:ATP-binding protein [Streptomyces sp. SID13726]NEB03896.1 ATP-binding protein [Streptomyces sp. SID13726]